MAEQYNPRLSVAGAEIDMARAGLVTARARPNPDANYMGGGQRLRRVGAYSGMLQHWGVSQLVELPSIRSTRIEAAERNREVSERALEEERLLLRGSVKQAFYQILRRRGEVALADETLRLVDDLRQRVQVQVEVGEAGQLELTRAEAELSTARTFLRGSQLREAAALAELRALLSAPLDSTLRPQAELEPAIDLPAFAEVVRTALSLHPAVQRAEAEVSRSRARVDAEKALRIPQPILIAEYEQMPDLRFFRAGVAITLPVRNQRQGPVAEAVAELSRANSARAAIEVELRGAIERAYNTYQIATQQVNSFESGVLRGARAALEGAEAAFRFGERGIIEVLDAQRVLRSVRMDFLNAQFDRQSALIELEQLRAVNTGGNRP